MRLPWWGYCGAELRAGYGMQGRNRRYPPGGGTRYYRDPVSRTYYKTCGNSGLGGWSGSPNYAVCCSGNTEGRSSQGDTAALGSTFQNARGMVVGNAQFYWIAAAQARAAVGTCNNVQYIRNYGRRKYNENTDCRSLTACPPNQVLNRAITRLPQNDRAANGCQAITTCTVNQRWANRRADFNETILRFLPRFHDRYCEACPAGSTAVAPNAESCDCVTCPSDEYRLGRCVLQSTGRASAQLCMPLTTCGESEFESSEPTATSDRVCKGCRSCPTNFWHPNVCAGEGSDCNRCTSSCASGQWAKAGCTSTTDTVCMDHTVCHPTLQYQLSAGTGDADTMCAPLTVCAAHEFESVAATDTSDRVCLGRGALLPICPRGQYEHVPPAPGATSRDCRPIATECTDSETELAAPTLTSNRMCRRCYVCPAGSYKSANCSDNSPTVCSECATCTDTQVMQTPCSADADRTCANVIEENGGLGFPTDSGVTPASVRTVNGHLLINGKNAAQEINRLNSVIHEMGRAAHDEM